MTDSFVEDALVRTLRVVRMQLAAASDLALEASADPGGPEYAREFEALVDRLAAYIDGAFTALGIETDESIVEELDRLRQERDELVDAGVIVRVPEGDTRFASQAAMRFGMHSTGPVVCEPLDAE